jgi:polyisoprenoid-binding protein YceI
MQKFIYVALSLLLIATYSTAQTGSFDGWKFNKEKSSVMFIAKNLGLNVSGTMTGMEVIGNFYESNISEAKFLGRIDVTTIKTGIELRDNHLKSSDYFDVKKYPKIVFRVKSITSQSGTLIATGDLTIKGITKEKQIMFTVERKEGSRIFNGNIVILRREFEVGGNSALVLADTIKIRIIVVFEQ